MSFLSDTFEGNWGHLGTDLSNAGSSLMSHPSQLYETLGGAAAIATGGLALGAFPELGAAGAGSGLLSGFFGAGADAVPLATDAAPLALTTDTASEIAASPAQQAISSVIGGAADQSAINPVTGANVLTGENPLLGPISADPITGVGTGAATPPGAAPAQPGFFDNITNSLMHPTLGGVAQGAGVAAAGAGLGMNLLRGNQVDPNQQKLQDLAGQLGSQGQVLESYLKTGKLPPALQTQLDQAKASEKARIISGYAQRGQPTDPRMNSALAQELNNVDTNAIAAMAQVQVQMLNTGLKETGMSMELYQMLTQMDEQHNQDLMKSISTFAAALGGGFGGSKAA